MKTNALRMISITAVAAALLVATTPVRAHHEHQHGYAPRYHFQHRPAVLVFPPSVVRYVYTPAPVYYGPPPPVYVPAPAYYGPPGPEYSPLGAIGVAVAGAALGSGLGQGNGRAAAIAIGSIVGAVIGERVATGR